MHPMLCGVNMAVLPLASGNPPGFGPFYWDSIGVCWWVTTASVSVSLMNRPCCDAVSPGREVALAACVGRQHQKTKLTGIACRAVWRSRFLITTT